MRVSGPHTIGFDDAPFARAWRGDVPVYGAVCAGHTLHGVVSGRGRRDGRNSTAELACLTALAGAQVRLVLLQGIALAGFNVVDIHALHAATGGPVLVVARRPPRLDAVRAALLEHVPGGAQMAAGAGGGGDGAVCGRVGAARGPESGGRGSRAEGPDGDGSHSRTAAGRTPDLPT